MDTSNTSLRPLIEVAKSLDTEIISHCKNCKPQTKQVKPITPKSPKPTKQSWLNRVKSKLHLL